MEVEMFFNISNVYLYFRLLTVFCEVAKSKVVIYVILYAVLLFFEWLLSSVWGELCTHHKYFMAFL